MLTLQQRLPSGILCYKRGRFKAIITEQEIAGLKPSEYAKAVWRRRTFLGNKAFWVTKYI